MSLNMYENIKCNINIINIELLKLMWPVATHRRSSSCSSIVVSVVVTFFCVVAVVFTEIV